MTRSSLSVCVLSWLLALAQFSVPFPLRADEPAAKASRLYEDGLQAFQEGNINTAKIHIKNSILNDPTLISSHILLGRIYLEESDGLNAEREMLIAERLGASRTLTLVPTARAYLLQKKYQSLLDDLNPTLRAPATDSELMNLKGQAHLELEQFAEAVIAYDKAAELNPKAADPVVGKGMALLRQGKFAAAEAEAIAAIKLEPENPGSWHLKGSIQHAQGNLQQALADYQKAISYKPDYLSAQISKVGVLIDLRQYEKAEKTALQAKKDHPKDPRISYLLAVTLAKQDKKSSALSALKDADDLLARLPANLLDTHGPSAMLAGLVRYSLKKWEQAYVHLDNYIKLNPEHPGARKLLGSILLTQKQYAKAIEVLEPALKTANFDQSLLTLLGEAYMKEGRHYKASEVLDRALRLNPDSTQARTQRALNNLAWGKEAAAIEDLEGVFENRPAQRDVGVLLILAQMKQRRYTEAVDTAERLSAQHPGNLTYLNLLASAQTYSGNLESARQNYEQLLVMDPDFRPARLNLGKLDLMQGRYRDAEERFSLLLEQRPKSGRTMLELARALAGQGRTNDAIRWLEKARSVDPKALDAVPVLVDLLIRAEQPARARQVAEEAELVAPGDLRVMGALGRAQLALGKEAVARTIFRRMSANAGYDSRKLYRIANLQRSAGDLKGAIWSLQKAVEAEPEFLAAHILLVRSLLANRQVDKALEQAELIKQRHGKNPVGYLILGEIAASQGAYEKALEHYRAAGGIMPSTAQVLGVNRILRAMGKSEAAEQKLQGWLQSHPEDIQVKQALAEDYMRQGKWESAAREYESVLAINPNVVRALNNLAFIYETQGNAESLALAEKAIELSPRSASVNDTLGWILVLRDRYLDGLKYLRNASALAPENPEIHYHLGVALFKLGNPAEAKKELRKALGNKRDFDAREQAASLLQEID